MKRGWSPSSIRELARQHFRKEKENASLDDEESAPQAETAAAPASLPPATEMAGKLSYWSQFEASLGDRVVVTVPAEEKDDTEMVPLCQTLGLQIEEIVPFRSQQKIEGATYIGRGNLSRLKKAVEAHACGGVVVDAPLKPSQVRNLEKALGVPVVDREALILSIFHAHARTRQAQLQVELAQLKYLQSRLAGLWMGLSRQSGGGGFKGRGLGETRLELDRRTVKRRIALLSQKIKESEQVFRTQASRRADCIRVALVGYTNAGKSTLMRCLTKAEVLVEDKLFATLDTTVRPLVPPTSPKILISDTVGFIKKLPHNLVASFRSTLSEAVESRLILHVVDASDPNWQEHFQTTEEVLGQIGAQDVPRLLVLNKTDALRTALILKESQARRLLRDFPLYVGQVSLSARSGQGVELLRQALMEHTGAALPSWALRAE